MVLWQLSPHRGGNGYRRGGAVALRPINARRRGDEDGRLAPGTMERLVRGEPAEAAAPGGAGDAAAEAALRRRNGQITPCPARRKPGSSGGIRTGSSGPARPGPTRLSTRHAARAAATALGLPAALTDEVAIAPSIPDIKGVGGCGGEDLVRLEAVVLPDRRRVSLKPAAVLRCAMATAIADWIRSDMAPLAQALGAPPLGLPSSMAPSQSLSSDRQLSGRGSLRPGRSPTRRSRTSACRVLGEPHVRGAGPAGVPVLRLAVVADAPLRRPACCSCRRRRCTPPAAGYT